jgi:hypothetical protein
MPIMLQGLFTEQKLRALAIAIPPDMAARALTNLIAVGSVVRREPTEPGLLPCRVHSFYRA